MRIRKEYRKVQVISIIIYLILTVGGLILVKLGSDTINLSIVNGTFNFAMGIKAIVGFLCYIASFIIYTFYIIRKFDLSYIYPIITGITQVLVILASVFILKEHISIPAIIGIVLIIIGIFCLNIK